MYKCMYSTMLSKQSFVFWEFYQYVPAENYKGIGMKLGQFFLPLVPPNT